VTTGNKLWMTEKMAIDAHFIHSLGGGGVFFGRDGCDRTVSACWFFALKHSGVSVVKWRTFSASGV